MPDIVAFRSAPATVPQLAAEINERFPEIRGRAIPVADPEITSENVLRPPFAMVYSLKEDYDHNAVTHRDDMKVTEEIGVEFWQKVERYREADGTETPFWAYYDYASLRMRMLAMLAGWEPDIAGGDSLGMEMVRMDNQAIEIAWVVRFTLRHTFNECADDLIDEQECEPTSSDDACKVFLKAGPKPLQIKCDCELCAASDSEPCPPCEAFAQPDCNSED